MEESECYLHRLLLQAITRGAALCLLASLSGESVAQPPTDTAASASLAALQKYLAESCDVPPRGTEERKKVCGVELLIRYKDDIALKRKLVGILTSGPDSETVGRATAAAERRWQAREAFAPKRRELAGESASGSGGGTGAPVTKDVYVKRQLDHLTRVYQEKAATALAAIDPDEANR